MTERNLTRRQKDKKVNGHKQRQLASFSYRRSVIVQSVNLRSCNVLSCFSALPN